ncbi:14620_t:CDS:2, partial [Racocetra persica]
INEPKNQPPTPPSHAKFPPKIPNQIRKRGIRRMRTNGREGKESRSPRETFRLAAQFGYLDNPKI